MTWTLVDEMGLEYHPSAGEDGGPELNYPVLLERDVRGAYLIVDELGRRKALGHRIECRVLRVSAEGTVFFDSQANGIDDGYGCLAGPGEMAILRRTKWELLVLGEDGNLVRLLQRCDRPPRGR